MFLCQSIDHVETFFNQREPQVLAFLPEAGRFERLRREARSLVYRFANSETRPPLYGTLISTLNLPTGNNAAGLPLGLQVTASWYADERFAWSVALEQAPKK